MTRKTARISFFVEYDDASPNGHPSLTHENCPDDMGDLLAINVHNAQMIGGPVIDHHTRPVSSISFDEMMAACALAQIHGGSFDKALFNAMYAADSENRRKLADEFWNRINKYRGMP